MKIIEKHTTWRGVQSPFLFDLARHLDGRNTYWNIDCDDYNEIKSDLKAIEELRNQMLKSKTLILVEDYGAGSRVFKSETREVSKLAKHVLQPENIALALWRVLMFWDANGVNDVQNGREKRILEMGTSLGLTTAYLASTGWKVETWEGCKATADFAKDNWLKLGCSKKIISKTGLFQDLLEAEVTSKWDVVFLDGHHDGGATCRYVETLKSHINKNGCIIIDDINWSKGMKSAWAKIISDPYWNMTLNWRGKGWLFHRDCPNIQHIKLCRNKIISNFLYYIQQQ